MWSAQGGTRTATIRAVADTIHGIPIDDPYRWLEDQQAKEVHDWITRQASHADRVMGPENALRSALRSRLTELMDTPAPGNPRKAGEWEYFTLRRTGEPVAAIYRRRAPSKPSPVVPDSQYEVVVNPIALRADGTTSVNIEGFSTDGRLMVYSVRDGGPDEISVYVRDLVTGVNLPDSLPRALYSSLSFAQDGKGSYYVHRSRQVGPRFRHHQFGDDSSRDSVIFGSGYGPTAFLNVTRGEGGRYRVYTVGHGWARNEVHVEDTAHPGSIVHLTEGMDAHFSPQFVDGKLWLRTDFEAPRGRVVVVDLTSPARGLWIEVIPQD
jgi:prolyl oligopeptidase